MIHSSLGEGCSNAILEANAAGLIFVASNTGGTHEFINEWDFLFEYKNSQDLNKKLNEAIELTLIMSLSGKRFKIQQKINFLLNPL